jgi:hypothetical protein
MLQFVLQFVTLTLALLSGYIIALYMKNMIKYVRYSVKHIPKNGEFFARPMLSFRVSKSLNKKYLATHVLVFGKEILLQE